MSKPQLPCGRIYKIKPFDRPIINQKRTSALSPFWDILVQHGNAWMKSNS